MNKLLVIGYVWPEPNSSAAGRRMMQLLEFFLSEGYEITFATTASETGYTADLEGLGIRKEKIELNNESFDRFVTKLQPGVVLYDRYMMEEQFGWRVSESCPDALSILDTEDLHFFRKARQEAFKKGMDLTPSLLQSDLAKREIAAIFRCDLSLIISKVEMNLLQEKFQVPEELLMYLPFMEEMPSQDERSTLPLFNERQDFVSIGNFLHAPNQDAVLHLKQNIWPLIRKELPQARIHIYGAYVNQKDLQLHNEKEGFLIEGRALNAHEAIKKARVLLAPLRFGAGQKGKFIDAMKTGTPTATTNVGAEGMKAELPWNGVVADDEEAFALAAVQLYNDQKTWEGAVKNGFELLEKLYSKKGFSAVLRNRILDLLHGLKKHREYNFTGAMLKQHQLNSTKYLSKYIEIKNELERSTSKK
ncbi:glycosyltransferase family 4 protein [Salinimicrobium flavum]|uniref:Glycosyltransferase family 4 protein n=1 Tax=Salinimicrobium flavum TaxID=1737065 RepID=A0ABW5IZ38_9FLAO